MFETHASWLQAQTEAERKRRKRQVYRRAPQPTAAEIERMVASFIAERGSVTTCPPKFVAPTSNAMGA